MRNGLTFLQLSTSSIYEWPKPYREIYARYWLALFIPRLLTWFCVFTFFIAPVALYRGAREHADNIRRGGSM